MPVVREPRSWRPKDEIDPSSRKQLRYWCRRFGVSPEVLQSTIQEVGPRVAAVATEFGCVAPLEEPPAAPEPAAS